MNTIELDRALRKLRLSGMAATLVTRVIEAQTSSLPPLDFLSWLVNDELQRRQDRLIERRIKKARFRDRSKTLDTFDFNKKMDRRMVFELATGRFIEQAEDAIFLGPPGCGRRRSEQPKPLAPRS